MNKNDEVIIDIIDIGSDGEGIGKVGSITDGKTDDKASNKNLGFTLFVKNALVGDKVKVKVMKAKKNYGYARIVEIIESSPYRVTPKCEIAHKCGGCSIQHLDYKKQLEYKLSKVQGCLKRIGGFNEDIPFEPIIGMKEPYYYRNKAQFPVSRDKDGNVIIGFYASGTHSIIDTNHCYIGAKENDLIINKVREFITKYNISTYDEEKHEGLVRHILTRVGFVTGEIMVCFIINGKTLPHSEEIVKSLCEIPNMKSISINMNTEKTNVILGDKVKPLYGETFIIDYIGDIKYQISPLSFYQVNPVQTKKLYETALDYSQLEGNEVVWDLYCGIGTISLFLAQKAKQVYGVEIVPQAIEDAKRNAMINGITNAEFFVGAAEDVLPKKYEEDGIYADVIVVDPPRKGCDETLLNTIVTMEPKRVVYVSCDPATLARDLRYLCDRGYEIKKVQVVDQFAHTVHVETCVLLTRKNMENYTVENEMDIKQ